MPSEFDTPHTHRTPPPPGQEPAGWGGVFATAGKILLGLGLLVMLMALTVLRNDPATSPHAAANVVPSSGAVILGAAAPETAPPTTLSPFQQAQAEGGYLAVEALVDPVRAYDKPPPESSLLHSFPQHGELGVTATFLAIEEAFDGDGNTWYRVRVPVRPNGSTAWLRASEVKPILLHNDLRIDLSDHRLDVYTQGEKTHSYPVGVGKGSTPTPPGDYYIMIKMKPIKENSVYGDLAMGISSFSEELVDWPGGGQVGIHGTNDPSSIGKDVSAGCIRLQNEDILELTDLAPLGTPVFVRE
jgi:lipoprotein-anchoring transpeptidase ErfK/SrfK